MPAPPDGFQYRITGRLYEPQAVGHNAQLYLNDTSLGGLSGAGCWCTRDWNKTFYWNGGEITQMRIYYSDITDVQRATLYPYYFYLDEI